MKVQITARTGWWSLWHGRVVTVTGPVRQEDGTTLYWYHEFGEPMAVRDTECVEVDDEREAQARGPVR